MQALRRLVSRFFSRPWIGFNTVIFGQVLGACVWTWRRKNLGAAAVHRIQYTQPPTIGISKRTCSRVSFIASDVVTLPVAPLCRLRPFALVGERRYADTPMRQCAGAAVV